MRILTNSPRWIFLAALVFAPWAYGSTRPWAIFDLNMLMLLVLGLWLADCIALRRLPVVPRALWISALFLLAEGWVAIANPAAYYDRLTFAFVPLKQWAPFLPGVIDRADAIPVMVRESALLGMVCFIADLVRRPAWRIRLWWTAALTGLSIIICGLVMRICDYHIRSYLDETDIGWYSFALYFYHANAAAYINLVLPLIAGLAALSFARAHSEAERALWVPGTVLCVAGAVASLSKGGMAISLLLLVVLGIWFIRWGRDKRIFNFSPAGATLTMLAVVGVIVAMASLCWPLAASRWKELSGPGLATGNERLITWLVCTRMFGDSGIWGFGPGNFTITFPHYTGALGAQIRGVWVYAHQDYLQTIIEWGYIGAVVWSVVFFGGLWTGWRTLECASLADPDKVLLTMSLLALCGVAVHSMFDFPLQIASIQLYAAMLLGIGWGSRALADNGSSKRHRSSPATPAVASGSPS